MIIVMQSSDKSTKIAHYLVERILHQKENPLLVAITGDSGSGKSYYLSKIREFLDVSEIPYAYVDFDDFLIARKDRIPLKSASYVNGPFAGKTKWEILENWFYLDKFETALKDLKHGKEATYYPYSRETGDIEEKKKIIKPESIILIATSILFDCIDFVILIETDQEKIIQRKIKRDSDLRSPKEIREMHEKVQGFFWSRNKPKNPDIIVDNNDIDNPIIVKTDI